MSEDENVIMKYYEIFITYDGTPLKRGKSLTPMSWQVSGLLPGAIKSPLTQNMFGLFTAADNSSFIIEMINLFIESMKDAFTNSILDYGSEEHFLEYNKAMNLSRMQSRKEFERTMKDDENNIDSKYDEYKTNYTTVLSKELQEAEKSIEQRRNALSVLNERTCDEWKLYYHYHFLYFRYQLDRKAVPRAAGAFGPGSLFKYHSTCIRVRNDNQSRKRSHKSRSRKDVYYTYEFWHSDSKALVKGGKVVRKELGENYSLGYKLNRITPSKLENYNQTEDRIIICSTPDVVESERERVQAELKKYKYLNNIRNFKSQSQRMEIQKQLCRDVLFTPFYEDSNVKDYFKSINGHCCMHGEVRITCMLCSILGEYIRTGKIVLVKNKRALMTYQQFIDTFDNIMMKMILMIIVLLTAIIIIAKILILVIIPTIMII